MEQLSLLAFWKNLGLQDEIVLLGDLAFKKINTTLLRC